MSQLAIEENNAGRNFHTIYEAWKAGRARDISDEPKANGAPAIVIGSGASLDIALPKLKDWKGAIICTTSHALSLVRFGAPPTHIFALDPFCRWEEIDGVDWGGYGTKLIITPTVWPSLVGNWPNDILLYRQNMGRKDSFYGTTLRNIYSEVEGMRGAKFRFIIRTEITLFACSPPAQLFCSEVLGYGPVYLVGCDFAYTYGKERFTDWTPINGDWEAHPHPYDDLPDEVKAQTMMMMSGIPTHPVHNYYKKNMVSAWRLSKQAVWTTDKGALTEMPYVDLDTVIRKRGLHIKGISEQEKNRRAEEYLALVGAYVIEAAGGYSFIESKDPENELPNFMKNLNRQYVCTHCGVGAACNTDDDQSGNPCPQCGEKTLRRKAYSDIGANMERIRSRIGAASRLKAKMEKKNGSD